MNSEEAKAKAKPFDSYLERVGEKAKRKKELIASSKLWKVLYKLEDTYCNVYYYLFNYDLLNITREIKWFCQRGKRGYCDRDAWGLNSHLAMVTKEGLIYLRKNLHGCPGDYVTGEENDFEKGMKKWESVIDEMIFAFDQAEKCADGDMHMYLINESDEENNRMRGVIKDIAEKGGYESLSYQTKEEYERMMAGFDLYKQNFFSLWD